MNSLIAEISQKNVDQEKLWIWWIGQEGFVLKTSRLTMYIDPYLSNFCERTTRGQKNEHVRMNMPPMQPEDVNNADIVLCTHDHADHIDPDGIPIIAQKSPQTLFVVPECAQSTMFRFGIQENRIRTLRGDDSLIIKGIEIYGIPAKHEKFDRDIEKGYPYLSYIIKLEGKITILHAGDTIPYEGQIEKIRKHNIDLAFVPINGRDDFRHLLSFEGNFTCEEAVKFALSIKATETVPMHYDMFTLNTADVTLFKQIADKHNLKNVVMEHAGSFCFPLDVE
jgi:L-ascorbate 6-phosphate lactonase